MSVVYHVYPFSTLCTIIAICPGLQWEFAEEVDEIGVNHPASALRPAIDGCDPVFTTPTARNEHPQQWGSHFVLLELGSTLSTSFSFLPCVFLLALSVPIVPNG
ncbi:uncharacterized protein AKAW2_11428S [Aspergillus luchuensis]|uniref:Uncharacterized protein n=1 Tax=Aspergillus kawachii TaxID=1069201 RepID=A0A7R7ZV95_ASPKA|nr:uncharacterized protein AKAW2_11428S [Aspergillus luchuensis]BCR94382.1 hypothetical protein AKAW2_11428S [Aspergillus luchuensis]